MEDNDVEEEARAGCCGFGPFLPLVLLETGSCLGPSLVKDGDSASNVTVLEA